MLDLRYYQSEAVEGVFNWFAAHPEGNPLIALPTGTGKSVVIAEFIRRAIACYPATRVMIATHVKELVSQNHAEMLELWPMCPCGIYSAGLNRRDMHFPVTFCGIASIVRRVSDFGHIDLLIIDEAHMVSHREATMYNKAIAALKTINPALRVIGLTATPFRLGLGMLTEGDLFTDISTDYCTFEKFNKLVDDGFIAPLIPRQTDIVLHTEGVHIQGGDFVQSELQDAVDKRSLTLGALKESIRLAQDREHWLVFCTGIRHANNTRDIMHELGVSAVCVHTDLPGGDDERDRNIAAFKAGDVTAMVGIGVFSTGFNHKPVDCIVWLRPTMSPVFWVQGNGRGTRPSPETGKRNCLVLDFARNTVRLGPINDPMIPRPPGKKGSGMVPFKLCPECNAYNHTRAIFCIDCGYEFPVVVKNLLQHASSAELIRREKPPKPPKPPAPPKPSPVMEEYRVNRVEFAPHRSKDPEKPLSMKVTYVCGLRMFNEWLCFEHEKGFPRHKAREAWRLMAGDDSPPPDTVDEALARVGSLQPPSTIRVLRNGRYDEVIGYDFDKRLEESIHAPGTFVDEQDPF